MSERQFKDQFFSRARTGLNSLVLYPIFASAAHTPNPLAPFRERRPCKAPPPPKLLRGVPKPPTSRQERCPLAGMQGK